MPSIVSCVTVTEPLARALPFWEWNCLHEHCANILGQTFSEMDISKHNYKDDVYVDIY